MLRSSFQQGSPSWLVVVFTTILVIVFIVAVSIAAPAVGKLEADLLPVDVPTRRMVHLNLATKQSYAQYGDQPSVPFEAIHRNARRSVLTA